MFVLCVVVVVVVVVVAAAAVNTARGFITNPLWVVVSTDKKGKMQDNQTQTSTNEIQRTRECKKKVLEEARFSTPVQTGRGINSASCKMDTGSLPRSRGAGAWR